MTAISAVRHMTMEVYSGGFSATEEEVDGEQEEGDVL
jgi:hypothetical protein